MPLVPPPPGQVTDFDAPNPMLLTYSSVTFTFLSISIVFAALRTYTRAVLLKAFGIDDCKLCDASMAGFD